MPRITLSASAATHRKTATVILGCSLIPGDPTGDLLLSRAVRRTNHDEQMVVVWRLPRYNASSRSPVGELVDRPVPQTYRSYYKGSQGVIKVGDYASSR